MRIGIGYDVHRLIAGRPLILGGVDIPYDRGLDGHSDADVLIHAIMDAVLGALCLGDIGKHFPDSDSAYLGISSLKLLERVNGLISNHGYAVSNLDTVIIAEEPKLAPYIQQMQTNISSVLGMAKDDVSIKATTTEKLGFCGQGEGIAAQAIVLIARGQV
ncbi:MAG: 2-C-methyl-D-erythritol 2,4-cyclodiphosphate synthase [Dethiobacter sp.]|jgi:2-C-methyl-D-erythritol 2,4-cyclodiphosphate synthase|nr:2-C-methyl-D-erythritol 2,4-cyclodiphosphate synthase [Dethiobacter sp.]